MPVVVQSRSSYELVHFLRSFTALTDYHSDQGDEDDYDDEYDDDDDESGEYGSSAVTRTTSGHGTAGTGSSDSFTRPDVPRLAFDD